MRSFFVLNNKSWQRIVISMESVTKNWVTQKDQVEEIRRILTSDAGDSHSGQLYKFTMGLIGLHRDRNKECYGRLIEEFV